MGSIRERNQREEESWDEVQVRWRSFCPPERALPN
jgi:hypothetical protein